MLRSFLIHSTSLSFVCPKDTCLKFENKELSGVDACKVILHHRHPIPFLSWKNWYENNVLEWYVNVILHCHRLSCDIFMSILCKLSEYRGMVILLTLVIYLLRILLKSNPFFAQYLVCFSLMLIQSMFTFVC